MKIAFQMDPLEVINFASDSTWQIILEAAKKSRVYYYTPKDLFWDRGAVSASVQEILISELGYELLEPEIVNLEIMDVIFIRQDPPYDMAYLTTTYLLDKLSDKVLLVNNPKAIRDFPEKISVLNYPDLIPPTIITYNYADAQNFAKDYDKVVIKPLYSFAGKDVYCLEKDDINFERVMNEMIKEYHAPVVLQKFLPEVSKGDKRVILLNGEPVGGFVRVPKEGEIRANLAQGGSAVTSELTARERYICEAIKPMLVENGLYFVGIDIIDGYLTEINLTSPTGIVAMKELYSINLAEEIIKNICARKD